ncbi:MAG: EamA/RhaT family transporter, partial [Anaerolineales bacterium]
MFKKLQNQQVAVGTLCALGATAIWAGNYIIARSINNIIPPISLAFWRWLIAVVVLSAIAYKRIIAEWGVVKEHLGYLSITGLL